MGVKKLTTSIFIIFLLLFSMSAQAQMSCKQLFKNTRNYKTTEIQELFSGFFVTNKSENRQMFVKIEKNNESQPKQWLFLIHGLLDSHVGWDAVANRALEAGYGVIRIDLHGHARTLVKNGESSDVILDSATNYKTNVNDVVQVLKKLRSDYNIKNPYVVGHSYGGGIATALSIHPFGKNLIAPILTVIAPYVYRIDGYQAETQLYYMGGLPFLRFFRSLIPSSVRSQMESMTSDIYTDPFMAKLYTKHFQKLLEKRVPKYKSSNIRKIKTRSLRVQRRMERDDIIERHVQAAIEITKGIREFDGREVVELLPSHMQLNMILGAKDQLVPRELEIEFFNRLKERNIKTHLVEFDNVGHMVISEAPSKTFSVIDQQIHPDKD